MYFPYCSIQANDFTSYSAKKLICLEWSPDVCLKSIIYLHLIEHCVKIRKRSIANTVRQCEVAPVSAHENDKRKALAFFSVGCQRIPTFLFCCVSGLLSRKFQSFIHLQYRIRIPDKRPPDKRPPDKRPLKMPTPDKRPPGKKTCLLYTSPSPRD